MPQQSRSVDHDIAPRKSGLVRSGLMVQHLNKAAGVIALHMRLLGAALLRM